MSGNQISERIVIAAAELFLRYGFARTTMGEIASAAGISRPTLYANFPGKEDVFEAAVLHLNALRLKEIEAHLAPLEDLGEKLWTACRLWLVQVYELQQTTPDARDMDDLSFGVVRKVYSDLTGLIAGLIAAHCDIAQSESQKLARILVFSIRGLGTASRDVADFTSLVQDYVRLFCRAIFRESQFPSKAVCRQ